MTIATIDHRLGVIKTTPMASIVAAATGTALHTLSPGRTARVIKLHIANRNAANAFVQIGTGLAGAFAASIPAFFVPGGTDRPVTEEEMEEFEFTANITAASTAAAAAPNDVQVIATVKEYQGVTG